MKRAWIRRLMLIALGGMLLQTTSTGCDLASGVGNAVLANVLLGTLAGVAT